MIRSPLLTNLNVSRPDYCVHNKLFAFCQVPRYSWSVGTLKMEYEIPTIVDKREEMF